MGSGNKLQRRKKDPWSFRERERQGKGAWIGRGRGKAWVVPWEGELAGFFVLRALKGGDCRGGGGISIEYSSAVQGCPFRVLVSTDWSVTGQGVISQCSWS